MAIRSPRDESRAATQHRFPLRYAARKPLCLAPRASGAAFLPRAESAGRLLRRADGSAEIHHRLGEIAGAPLRGEFARTPPQFRLGAGQRFGDGKKPRDHTFDVAVHRTRGKIERNRGDSGRGIIPNSRKRAQRRFARRQHAAVTLDDGASASVQVAGASVIAQSRPAF